jgi:hypothetical protein
MSLNRDEAIDFPDDADGDALRRVATDSDMDRPMAIDFMVAVPNELAGREIVVQVASAGFTAYVAQDDESGKWTCYCTKTMLATYDGIVSAQSELDLLAQPFGGYSDGWGTWGNRQGG